MVSRRGLVMMVCVASAAGMVVAHTVAAEQSLTAAPIPPGLLEDERNTIEVFRHCSRSVVFIVNARTRRDFFTLNAVEVPQGSGSGFVWDTLGHVVTNFHVIQNGDAWSVTLSDGKRYDAELVGSEPNKDVAVLRIKAPASALVPLDLGNSEGLVVGQKVLAIGNPFGLDQTLTTGVISALGREIKSVAGTTISDVIQTDASINPGNSGGPLLDSPGRLIGLNTAIYSPSGASAGIGFAVPVATIKRVVPQILEFGHVKRAGLGVTPLADGVSRQYGIDGVVIRDVARGGAAARAGLRGLQVDRFGSVILGDIIIGIDDREIHTFDDMYQALDRRHAGDHVRVRVRNERRERSVDLVLQELD